MIEITQIVLKQKGRSRSHPRLARFEREGPMPHEGQVDQYPGLRRGCRKLQRCTQDRSLHLMIKRRAKSIAHGEVHEQAAWRFHLRREISPG